MTLPPIRVSPTKPQKFFTATYAQPGGMRAGFRAVCGFLQDAKDNKVFEQTKLTMAPVMAVVWEKSLAPSRP